MWNGNKGIFWYYGFLSIGFNFNYVDVLFVLGVDVLFCYDDNIGFFDVFYVVVWELGWMLLL